MHPSQSFTSLYRGLVNHLSRFPNVLVASRLFCLKVKRRSSLASYFSPRQQLGKALLSYSLAVGSKRRKTVFKPVSTHGMPEGSPRWGNQGAREDRRGAQESLRRRSNGCTGKPRRGPTRRCAWVKNEEALSPVCLRQGKVSSSFLIFTKIGTTSSKIHCPGGAATKLNFPFVL